MMNKKFNVLKGAVVMALAGVLYLAPAASAQRRAVVVGPAPVIVRPGWAWGPGWGWGYGPGYWGPAYYGPGRFSHVGTVKIDTHRKDASVYVDGGYAGPVDKLKKFDLPQGNHDIELRDQDNRSLYSERLHIIPGKTIKVKVG